MPNVEFVKIDPIVGEQVLDLLGVDIDDDEVVALL
jgi:hypothetical protein